LKLALRFRIRRIAAQASLRTLVLYAGMGQAKAYDAQGRGAPLTNARPVFAITRSRVKAAGHDAPVRVV
jgi:hypothetical protein